MFWNRRNGRYASMPATLKPLARSDELIIEEVDGELLIYDDYNDRAHCLSVDAARVWRAADGTRSEEAIALELDLEPSVVAQALGELDEKALLNVGPSTMVVIDSDGAGTTRREFGLKSAKIGGAVAAAPLIYSIIPPTAVASATTPNFLCNYYSGNSCDACTAICGCCCCCQGCSKPLSAASCKVCSSVDFCTQAQANVKAGDTSQDGCLDQQKIMVPGLPDADYTPCTSGPNCSAKFNPATCSPPCTNGVPTIDCKTHDCNCFGIITDNPCNFT